MWDTGDKFMGLAEGYYLAAKAFILFFDWAHDSEGHLTGIQKIQYYLNLMKSTMLSVQGPAPPVIFVGNKLDLVDHDLMVNKVGLCLNYLNTWLNEHGEEYGLGTYSIMTMSVKEDSVDDLLAPLLQLSQGMI